LPIKRFSCHCEVIGLSEDYSDVSIHRLQLETQGSELHILCTALGLYDTISRDDDRCFRRGQVRGRHYLQCKLKKKPVGLLAVGCMTSATTAPWKSGEVLDDLIFRIVPLKSLAVSREAGFQSMVRVFLFPLQDTLSNIEVFAPTSYSRMVPAFYDS